MTSLSWRKHLCTRSCQCWHCVDPDIRKPRNYGS